jgi:hypothetical protein
MNGKQVRRALELIEGSGTTLATACTLAGIRPAALERARRAVAAGTARPLQRALIEGAAEADKRVQQRCLAVIRRAAKAGDRRAAAWLAERNIPLENTEDGKRAPRTA